jgi:hypothetical protein
LLQYKLTCFPEFDEGHLKFDSMAAADEVVNSLAILDETHPPIPVEENPYWHAYQSVWLRLKERTSFGKAQRSYYIDVHSNLEPSQISKTGSRGARESTWQDA